MQGSHGSGFLRGLRWVGSVVIRTWVYDLVGMNIGKTLADLSARMSSNEMFLFRFVRFDAQGCAVEGKRGDACLFFTFAQRRGGRDALCE